MIGLQYIFSKSIEHIEAKNKMLVKTNEDAADINIPSHFKPNQYKIET